MRKAVHNAQDGLDVTRSECQVRQLVQSAAGRRHELGEPWRGQRQLAGRCNALVDVLAVLVSCATPRG
jgi:hypothetical protein